MRLALDWAGDGMYKAESGNPLTDNRLARSLSLVEGASCSVQTSEVG